MAGALPIPRRSARPRRRARDGDEVPQRAGAHPAPLALSRGLASVLGIVRGAALAALLLASAAEAASIVLVRVEASALNVRARPSAASEVVGHMKRGDTTVATVGSADGWLIVRTRDGRTGYIAARFVELVRVVAVDGEPVPSRPAGSEDAGSCGPVVAPIELEIRDARLSCTERALGNGVESCEVAFELEASTECAERVYRTLECEIGIAWRDDGGTPERTASAVERTVMVIDAGTATDEVVVSWKSPADETVRAVRLATGSCALR